MWWISCSSLLWGYLSPCSLCSSCRYEGWKPCRSAGRYLFFFSSLKRYRGDQWYTWCMWMVPNALLKKQSNFKFFSPHEQAQQKGVNYKIIYTRMSSKVRINTSTSVWRVECWGSLLGGFFSISSRYTENICFIIWFHVETRFLLLLYISIYL